MPQTAYPPSFVEYLSRITGAPIVTLFEITLDTDPPPHVEYYAASDVDITFHGQVYQKAVIDLPALEETATIRPASLELTFAHGGQLSIWRDVYWIGKSPNQEWIVRIFHVNPDNPDLIPASLAMEYEVVSWTDYLDVGKLQLVQRYTSTLREGPRGTYSSETGFL